MAKVNRVSHVVLNASDPEASAKWYSEALGMELMSYSSDCLLYTSPSPRD